MSQILIIHTSSGVTTHW